MPQSSRLTRALQVLWILSITIGLWMLCTWLLQKDSSQLHFVVEDDHIYRLVKSSPFHTFLGKGFAIAFWLHPVFWLLNFIVQVPIRYILGGKISDPILRSIVNAYCWPLNIYFEKKQNKKKHNKYEDYSEEELKVAKEELEKALTKVFDLELDKKA